MRHVAIHSASISIYDRDSIRHFCHEKMGFPASQVWLERVWLISAFAGEIARICPFMVWDEKKGWRNVVNPIVKKTIMESCCNLSTWSLLGLPSWIQGTPTQTDDTNCPWSCSLLLDLLWYLAMLQQCAASSRPRVSAWRKWWHVTQCIDGRWRQIPKIVAKHRCHHVPTTS